MSEKNIVLLVCAHQGYIRNIDSEKDYGPENDILFGAISQTYVPLLNMLHSLENDGVEFKISLVLSPVLCSLLTDSVIQTQYIQWLDKRIALGEREIERLKNDEELLKNAKKCFEKAKKDKFDFVEVYRKNLVREFSNFAKKGLVELLATAGTYAFLPHFSDMTEILNAQVETGIYSHKYYFGTAPDGFWLPYMGYDNGIENVLRSYGITYTVLDSNGILFSKDAPATGVFTPCICKNALVLFAKDCHTPHVIYNEEDGFMHNPLYKAQERDIGFELLSDDLSDFGISNQARVNTLYRYWANGNDNTQIYDEEKAHAEAVKDADTFLKNTNETLSKAAELIEKDVSIVCAFDAEAIGQKWAEGVLWLENVIRRNSESKFAVCSELIGNQFKLPRITPYASAFSDSGYGEDLLDSTNSWMLRYTRKMCQRIVDLAERFPSETGLKARLLNIGAKELMLAQSSEWAKMLHQGIFTEYVEQYFKACTIAFTTVFDSLGSNTVSTEWLTNLEKEHCLFPWMNYRIFSRKI